MKGKTVIGQREHLEKWLEHLDTKITVRHSSRRFPLFVFVTRENKGLMAVNFRTARAFLAGLSWGIREKTDELSQLRAELERVTAERDKLKEKSTWHPIKSLADIPTSGQFWATVREKLFGDSVVILDFLKNGTTFNMVDLGDFEILAVKPCEPVPEIYQGESTLEGVKGK